MRAIEVHVIETDDDINLAMLSGLIEIDDLDSMSCDECSEDIGHLADDVFEEFSIAIYSDDTSRFVCSSCSAPITERESTIEFEIVFDGLVDGLDDFIEATFDESDLGPDDYRI